MRRELHLNSPDLPTSEELIFYELGQMIERGAELSSIIKERVKLNPTQQKMWDLLETADVSPGMWIHLMCYGGTGGGKTWAILLYAIDKMLAYPGVNVMGVRATLKDLRQTIYKDCKHILDKFGIPYTSNDTRMVITLENGSEFWMTSDKSLTPSKSDKADSLGGTQFTIVILEEADSISSELAETIPGRMRQRVGGLRKVIFYDCNPPGKKHWTYQWWWNRPEGNDVDDPASRWRACWFPQEGNEEHVGKEYIEAVAQDYANNPILYRRMRLGQFGVQVKGKPIYMREFSPERHVWQGDGPLPWNKAIPLIAGWDFGFNGTALVVVQDDTRTKQIKILYAHVESNCILNIFMDEIWPQVKQQFPGAQWVHYCDPAGVQKRTEGKSCIDILKDHGVRARYRRTHSVAYGISVIMRQLRLNLNGRAVVVIDPEAEVIIEAFSGGYANKKDVADKEIDPVKDGYYDHAADALRYVFVNIREYGQDVSPDAEDSRSDWKSLTPQPSLTGGHVRQRALPIRTRSLIR